LIVDYLAQYRKALSPDDAARIAAAPQSANPLYLCALLEELRVFGVHEQLDNHIDHYLAADTIPALYERILARWEQDYDRDRPNLVRDAMTCLWAARRGLSESELLGLLRTDGEPMPRAYWSPLHLAADHSLVTRSGLIGFSHDHLRTAVRRRYLGDNRQRAAHLTLADYFAGMGVGQRKVDELPWQLERASAWQQLQDLLTDGSFFMAAWAADDFMGQFEVKRYWAQLEANSPFRVADAYGSVLDGSVETGDLDFAYQVARLVLDTGYPQKALPLMARIVRHFRSRGKPAALVGPLVTLAVMLQDAGRLDEAWATHREAERLCRETGDRAALAATLQNEGVILRDTGKLREAVGRFDEAVAIFGEIGGSAELLHCLGHEIPALVVIGDRSRAMGLLDELERVSRAHGYIPGIIEALNKRGADLGMQRRWRESLTAHEREATLCRQVGDRVGLQRALGSQALALGQLQDFEPALALYEEAEAICRGIGNKTGLGCSLGGRARILREMGQLDQAQALQEEEASLWRELGNEMALGACLVEQAVTAQRQGDLGRAVRLMASAQSILARCGIDPSKIAGQ